MQRLLLAIVIVSATAFALTITGCNSAQTSTKTSTEANEKHDDATHDQGKDSDMEDMKEGLAKLSEADRESAEKQHVCPVSGEMLGTMGTPIKVDVQGQQVWICCEGCEKKLLNSPDKFLAKLNQK